MKLRNKLLLLTFILSIAFMSGCTEKENLKQKMQDALQKQAGIQSYHFSGNIEISLGTASFPAENVLTSALYALIKESTLKWNGKTSLETARLEADFSLFPKGVTSPINLPLLLKDNKLMFQLPIINFDDEYYEADLSQTNSAAFNEATQLTYVVLASLINEMEQKAFVNKKETTGTYAQTISLQISDNNKVAASHALQSGLSQYVENLVEAGVITKQQAATLLPLQQLNLTIASSSVVEFSLDETGYIRQISMNLSVSTTGKDGQDMHRINLTQNFDHINESLQFTKEIPTNLRSFNDVLQFLKK